MGAKAETLATHFEAKVQEDRSGSVLEGAPATTAEPVAGMLSRHIDQHLGSIRQKIGA